MLRVFACALIVVFFLRPIFADTPLPGSLDSIAAASQAAPQDENATKRLEASVCAGLPSVLTNSTVAALPVDAALLPYDLGTLIVPRDYLPTHAQEPQHGWKFSKVAYIYQNGPLTSSLFCTVHYPASSDAPLAARIARLLALAHQTLIHETGQEAFNGTAPFDVWLCRGGLTGGEQWKTNLYLYDIDTPRSSIEWVREVVHEYSHLALPAIGGYDAPEYWANGYLGERLIIRWLMRLSDGPARMQNLWGDFSGAPNFDRLLLAPALAQYKKIGPSRVWLARRDEIGMRYLIGEVLSFDDTHGPHRLGEAFARLPRFHEASATDFTAALSESLSASSHLTP